jgi:hypothetical protein
VVKVSNLRVPPELLPVQPHLLLALPQKEEVYSVKVH